MGSSEMVGQTSSGSLDYLRVNYFIKDMVSARALTSAFELRLIDTLADGGPVPFDSLRQVVSATDNGLKLLLALLIKAGVLETSGDNYSLAPDFILALQYRDLLLAKLDFAHIAAHDYIDLLSQLVAEPLGFMKRSGMFHLFNYGNALEYTPENRKHTERWVRITTTLTRYEAHACFLLHDFGKYRRMLDIGGNSGEFALQACRTCPELRATVLDLPIVCDIGNDYLLGKPESTRICFTKGNARTDALPAGFDLVTFKSMLHDWPEEYVRSFIKNACRALEPGGTLLIFERGPFEMDEAGLPYSDIPILLFAHTLRSPDLYVECLAENGLQQIALQWIDLEMPFFVVTGVKGFS